MRDSRGRGVVGRIAVTAVGVAQRVSGTAPSIPFENKVGLTPYKKTAEPAGTAVSLSVD